MSPDVSAFNPFKTLLAASLVALAGCATMNPPAPGKRELMIVGLDEKQSWDESGKAVIGPPGRDSVAIFDVGTDPLAPKTLVVLPLANTIVGPPVNLAITPDESLALVANSMNVVQEGGAWKQVPDNRIWVIDLTANPPRLIDTIIAGKQPSGMSINRAGNLALVANRADGSISVLRISGKKVELIDTVTIGEQVAHVVFTPDGQARGGGAAQRNQRLEERLLLQPQRPGGGAEDRRQKSDAHERSRGARPARRRGFQRRRALYLCRKLHRPGHLYPARGRRPDRKHRKIAPVARPPGVDARAHALKLRR